MRDQCQRVNRTFTGVEGDSHPFLYNIYAL